MGSTFAQSARTRLPPMRWGVNVLMMRFVYALIGGAIAGAGGAALSMSFTPGWAAGLVAGSGWIALAVVIFAAWRPGWLVLGAFLFGLMCALSFIGQGRGWSLPAPVLNMLPYILTLLLIAAPALFKRFRRATTPPAALATPQLSRGALIIHVVQHVFTTDRRRRHPVH